MSNCICGSEDFQSKQTLGLVTLSMQDTPLFNLFSTRTKLIGEGGNRHPEMNQQVKTFRHFSLLSALGAGDTTIDVGSAYADCLSTGTQFLIEKEIVQIGTRVTPTGSVYNITRGIGDVAPIVTVTSHPTGALAMYLGTPVGGGCKDLKCCKISGIKIQNALEEIAECYCVNERDIRNPDELSDGDPVMTEKIDKVDKILTALDVRAIYGVYNYTGKCDSNTSGGLRHFIRKYQGLIYDIPSYVTLGTYSAPIITSQMIRDFFVKIHANPSSGRPNVMILNTTTREFITRNQIGTCFTNCNGTTNGTLGGHYNKYVDPVTGAMIDVITSENIQLDEIYLVNTADLSKFFGRTKDGQPMFLYDRKDSENCGNESGTISAEVMYRVSNPEKQGLMQGFTLS